MNNASKFFLGDDQGDTRLTVNEGGAKDTGAAFRAYSIMLWPMQPTNMYGRNGYSDTETGLAYSPAGGYYSRNLGPWTQPKFTGAMGGSSAYAAGGGDPYGDDLSEATSWGDFYCRAGRKGTRELLGKPQFQPGSKERQFVSNVETLVPVIGWGYAGYTVVTGNDAIAHFHIIIQYPGPRAPEIPAVLLQSGHQYRDYLSGLVEAGYHVD